MEFTFSFGGEKPTKTDKKSGKEEVPQHGEGYYLQQVSETEDPNRLRMIMTKTDPWLGGNNFPKACQAASDKLRQLALDKVKDTENVKNLNYLLNVGMEGLPEAEAEIVTKLEKKAIESINKNEDNGKFIWHMLDYAESNGLSQAKKLCEKIIARHTGPDNPRNY